MTTNHRTSTTWKPPLASLASRRPAIKSTTSVRGTLVNPRTNREMVYESTLERDTACILMVLRGCRAVLDQPPAVAYIDDHGVRRWHTFDFLVVMNDGSRTAYAVKPARNVERSGLRRIVELIRQQRPDFADRFVILTEEQITVDHAANARLIIKSRRMRNEDHIAAVMAVVSRLGGSVKIADLLAATRNDGHGFMAVVCLIDIGVLEHAGPGRISHDSAVRPARTANQR